MNHIALKVNGIHIDRDVEDNLRLIDFLRDELYLTGTKEGCSVGSVAPVPLFWMAKRSAPACYLRRSATARKSRPSKRCSMILLAKNCRTPLFVTVACSVASVPLAC